MNSRQRVSRIKVLTPLSFRMGFHKVEPSKKAKSKTTISAEVMMMMMMKIQQAMSKAPKTNGGTP